MKKAWTLWVMSLLLSAGCVTINHAYFRVSEMIKLEFASSAEQMHAHIMAIGCSPGCCYHLLKMNTLVDYGFLAGYSLLAFFSLKTFLDVFQLPVKAWVYILSFLTGLLDAIENYFLLTTAIEQQEKFSTVFFWAVRIKWAVAIVPLLLIPMVAVYGLFLLFRTKQPASYSQ